MSAATDELHEALEAERAKTTAAGYKEAALWHLIGLYGEEAERSSSPGFKTLIETMRGVLDGTIDPDAVAPRIEAGAR